MDNSLLTALVISVVGMTLLFLSLVVFYGLLALLAAVVKDPSPPTEQAAGREATGDGKGVGGQEDAVLRAAAVAIALARAEAEKGSGPAAVVASEEAAADQPVSAWWSLHHQRQITANPDARRSR